jgi:hypothetical protein
MLLGTAENPSRVDRRPGETGQSSREAARRELVEIWSLPAAGNCQLVLNRASFDLNSSVSLSARVPGAAR